MSQVKDGICKKKIYTYIYICIYIFSFDLPSLGRRHIPASASVQLPVAQHTTALRRASCLMLLRLSGD